MTRFVLMWLALAACAGSKKDTEPTPPPAPTPTPAPEPAVAPAPVKTPAELYGGCKDRMELPEADAECKVDADCAPAGCGNEVCVAAAKKADVMTTCDEQPCYKVVDACGCHEGRCSWTLLAEVPPNVVPGGAKGMLPPTGKPPEPQPAPK